MALVSPVVQRSRVLQGSLVLLLLLVAGPFLCFKLFMALWPARWAILCGWLAAEWCFYIFWYLPTYEAFNRIPEPCEPQGFTDAEGRRMWRRFIAVTQALPGGVDPVPYLAQWFCNAPFESIKRGNVEEMLTYGFFYKKRHELSPDMQQYPSRMVDELEAALKVKFPPGYTPNMTFMKHLWEDLRAQHRPLLLYVFMEVLHLAQRLTMLGYGFHHRQMGLLGYYTLNCGLDAQAYHSHTKSSSSSSSSSASRFLDSLLGRLSPSPPPPRQPSGSSGSNGNGSNGSSAAEGGADWTPFADPSAVEDESPFATSAAAEAQGAAEPNPLEKALPKGDKTTPVMFLHGVGGLMLYLEMLKHVIALGHPVIVIEYKHVGMRLSSYIPSVDELTRNVIQILDFERIPKVCVVGHSYGSFMASRLNMKFRERLHSLCVIDPVALGMFMPHLLHNFMYRRPRVDVKRPDILLRDLVLWFASRDLHIAATFSRRFYWTELNMWPEDLPTGSCVVLSGNDDLCHADEVKKMCEVPGHINVIVNPNLFHGAFLLSRAHTANLMREVQNLLATSGSLVVHMARPVLAQTISAARSLLHEVETLTSRLSISPQPVPGGAAPLDHRRSTRAEGGGLWGRVNSLRGTLSSRTSMPTPSPPCRSPVDNTNSSSSSSSTTATRSPSAPLSSTVAAAATAATAQQQQQQQPDGTAATGWWGPAAAAAAAACDQQPEAAMGQEGSGSKGLTPRHQLSVIMSGPEGTMSDLTPEGASEMPTDSIVEDDWIVTDQDAAGAGLGLNPAGRHTPDQGLRHASFKGLGLNPIQEDSQELQLRSPAASTPAAAPAPALAKRGSTEAPAAALAKRGSTEAPAGPAAAGVDAAAVDDQEVSR